jgi:hypothetical protein
VTWTHGRHNVKAGFLIAHMDNYNNNAGSNSKGGFAISKITTPTQATIVIALATLPFLTTSYSHTTSTAPFPE